MNKKYAIYVDREIDELLEIYSMQLAYLVEEIIEDGNNDHKKKMKTIFSELLNKLSEGESND